MERRIKTNFISYSFDCFGKTLGGKVSFPFTFMTGNVNSRVLFSPGVSGFPALSTL